MTPVTEDNHRRLDDEFLPRREADALIAAARDASDTAKETHQVIHDAQKTALEMAQEYAASLGTAHNIAHDREHGLHAEKHSAEQTAVSVALAAVARERIIHAEAHEREHVAHQNEHQLNHLAITKAEKATDDRFIAANGYREQFGSQIGAMVRRDQFDTFTKENDRRYEEVRAAIILLEKGDVKGQGRSAGQGTVIAAIVGFVSFVATALGIVIILANVATTS